MTAERDAFIYGYMQGSSDAFLFGMEVTRDEAASAYEQWVEQSEIDPMAIGPVQDRREP